MTKVIFDLNCARKGKPHPKAQWLNQKAEDLRKQLSEINSDVTFTVRVKGARLIVILTRKGNEEIRNDILSKVTTLFEEEHRFKQVNPHLFSLF